MRLPTAPTVPERFRWTVTPDKPKPGASCSQPFCGAVAKYLLRRDGMKQRRNACDRCAKLLTTGTLTKNKEGAA
jgi:hypothetical protein